MHLCSGLLSRSVRFSIILRRTGVLSSDHGTEKTSIDDKSKLSNNSRNNNNNIIKSNDHENDAWLHNWCVHQMKCNRDTTLTSRHWLNFSSFRSRMETIHRARRIAARCREAMRNAYYNGSSFCGSLNGCKFPTQIAVSALEQRTMSPKKKSDLKRQQKQNKNSKSFVCKIFRRRW